MFAPKNQKLLWIPDEIIRRNSSAHRKNSHPADYDQLGQQAVAITASLTHAFMQPNSSSPLIGSIQ